MYTTKFFTKRQTKPIFTGIYKKNRYVIFDENSNKPFIYRIGRVKVTDIQKVEISSEESASYEKIYELVKIYGYKVVAASLGYDESNFGDSYLIHEISFFETIGQPYVDWLNHIAAADKKIAQFAQSKGLITVYNTHTNEYSISNNKQGFAEFTVNPFIGNKIQSAFLGYLLSKPILNTIALDVPLTKLWDYLQIDHSNLSINDFFISIGIQEIPVSL